MSKFTLQINHIDSEMLSRRRQWRAAKQLGDTHSDALWYTGLLMVGCVWLIRHTTERRFLGRYFAWRERARAHKYNPCRSRCYTFICTTARFDRPRGALAPFTEQSSGSRRVHAVWFHCARQPHPLSWLCFSLLTLLQFILKLSSSFNILPHTFHCCHCRWLISIYANSIIFTF